ncbi:hypothetical protein AQUCO_02500200v1 [Aquilegia coerulea]|uniref:Uncharacterized protein n=1 Tax=Aquilegia coerulea TaxID=218851 RepID=A0A2G5D9Z7_AQUCA|nr:hypothetical protein AQUCO_02500200v1 [Aquilegia coerulea]
MVTRPILFHHCTPNTESHNTIVALNVSCTYPQIPGSNKVITFTLKNICTRLSSIVTSPFPLRHSNIEQTPPNNFFPLSTTFPHNLEAMNK